VMRVVLVSPYALSVYGGVQEQTLAMSRELERRGTHVLIVAPDKNAAATYDTPAVVERFGTLHSLPANGSKAPLTLSPFAARQAHAAIKKYRPDVVHFHEPFAPLLGYAALRAHDYPSVATFHRSGGGPAVSLTGPLLRLLARGIDASAAVSDTAATTIHRASGLSPEVLFNGFETSRFLSTPRSRTDDVVVVTLGRLEERKGVRHAVNVVRAHNAKGEDPWRLVILGDGPQRDVLKSLAAGDDMITFVGAVSDDQKRAWLRRANVLVAPALRGAAIATRPGTSRSAATALKAPSIRVSVARASAKAITDDPAPDRQAPTAPASRAACTSAGNCG